VLRLGRKMRGTYTIIVECRSDRHVRFGMLGRAKVRKGYYLYTGSALGLGATSLERRLERHGSRSKKRRWHIDYLTTNCDCKVKGAVYLISGRRLECKVARLISKELNLTPILPRIGASDCNCEGHLLGPELRLNYTTLLTRVTRIYSRIALSRSSVVVHGSD
jgi:sugar fermentation stimulation protein A